MTRITTYLSVLTLNVNGLNSLIKRHHLANWIKKENPTLYCLQEIISKTETSNGLGRKPGRRFTKPMAPENREE
jgi:exonuclease III